MGGYCAICEKKLLFAEKCSERQLHIVLLGHATHVLQGIVHASQGRIDAHARALGNLLEGESLIEAHEHHLALCLRQVAHQAAHVAADLARDDATLHTVRGKALQIEDIHLALLRGDAVHVVFGAELIDNEVVANAREPGVKLPVLAIAALAYGHNGAHKGLLEKVVGYVGVVDSTKNVAIKAVLIARQQDIESFVVTGTVKLYQLLVGKLL